MAGCYTCYLILDYLKMVEISGGYDWGPCCACVFYDGSGYGLVGVYESFFVFAP